MRSIQVSFELLIFDIDVPGFLVMKALCVNGVVFVHTSTISHYCDLIEFVGFSCVRRMVAGNTHVVTELICL